MFYLGGKSLRQWEREGKWGREGGVICPVRYCSAGAAFAGFKWRLSRSPCSTPSAQLPDRLHGDEGKQALPSCSPSMDQCSFTLWAAWSDHLKPDLQTSVVAFLTQVWKWQEKTSTLSSGRELAFQKAVYWSVPGRSRECWNWDVWSYIWSRVRVSWPRPS